MVSSKVHSNIKFYLYRLPPNICPSYRLDLNFEIYTIPERTGTLLCSVTSENTLKAFLHQKLFHLLLVTSLSLEHAEMVQLLVLEILRRILSNRNNRVPVLSVDYHIVLDSTQFIHIFALRCLGLLSCYLLLKEQSSKLFLMSLDHHLGMVKIIFLFVQSG